MTDFAPQGSPEWYAERLGKVTASRIADVVARTQTGYGASRANYMAELVIERLTGEEVETYQSAAMRLGGQRQPQAQAAYAFMCDAVVELVGFVPHPSIAMAGASPDGYVGAHGLIEIKAPNSATHIETLLGETIPGKYVKQMQFQMACTGRLWCDFVSFEPNMPGAMQLWVKRVERDNALIEEVEKEVRQFLDELERKVDALRRRYELQQAA